LILAVQEEISWSYFYTWRVRAFLNTLLGLVCFAEICVTSRKFFTARDQHSFWSFTHSSHHLMLLAFPALFVSSIDVSWSFYKIILYNFLNTNKKNLIIIREDMKVKSCKQNIKCNWWLCTNLNRDYCCQKRKVCGHLSKIDISDETKPLHILGELKTENKLY